MPEIFISSARSTEDKAQEVTEALRALGYNVWRDNELPPHRNYADVLEENLREAKAVLVLWSQDAVRSQWVRSEADQGRAANKLVQATVDGAKPPMPFDQIQCAQLQGWSGDVRGPDWARIMRSIGELVGRAPAGAIETIPRVGHRLSQVSEFLEGLDLPGDEGFETWLTAKRRELTDRATQPASPMLPARIVDVSKPAPGFGGRPALAVLPFLNLTGDLESDYLAEGLSEELISRLSRLRWLPVISRGSSFAFRGNQDIDHAAIGRQLGAKYLFEGRLRRVEESFTLAVELSEATSRRVLWSHQLELPLIRSRGVQTEIIASLVGALDTRIDAAEQIYVPRDPEPDASVSDLIWRGRWYVNRLTRDDAARARALFDRALEIEPQSTEALIQAAWALARWIWAERRPREDIQRLRGLAQRAINADPEDGRAYLVAGAAEMFLRRPERAKALLHQARELSPSLAEAHSVLGDALCWNAEPELALESLRTALRLSPNDVMAFAMLSNMATGYWMLGASPEAVEHAEQSIVRQPGFWYAHAIKIAALADMGRDADAGRTYADLVATKPRFSIDAVDWVPFVDRTWNAKLKRRLSQASDAAPVPEE